MTDAIGNFENRRVVVVGDVMLDCYLFGSADRISPEAPVPVLRVTGEKMLPGGAGNVARNIISLGAKATLLAKIGQDEAGNLLEKLLSDMGVDTMLRRDPSVCTIVKLRAIAHQQQLLRIDVEPTFPPNAPLEENGDWLVCLSECHAIILSDYAKGVLRQPRDLIEAARSRGLPVIVDPKGVDFERYRGSTVITPNLAEFEAVVGRCVDDAEIVTRGEALRAQLGLDAVLVTRSERGMSLIARGQRPIHLLAQAREVYDVTGAGDTVVATLGAGLAAGMGMREAVSLANLAAALVVAKLGTATVSVAELRTALKIDMPIRKGVCRENELFALVQQARAAGQTVVMTNGCFDVLHAGHIDFLEGVRALGDRLIVAVNDDDSVRRLKGASRPVNSLAARTRIISALACVDWVVAFSEDTPERLICGLRPDVLVKGGDYTIDYVACGQSVQAGGGEVKALELMKGYSTSRLINRLQQRS